MTEGGGITELQQIEAEIAILERQLTGVEGAETVDAACQRLIASIQSLEGNDGFLVKEGAPAEHNQFHTSAGQKAEGGCCSTM